MATKLVNGVELFYEVNGAGRPAGVRAWLMG
jgi:hypothetical protein